MTKEELRVGNIIEVNHFEYGYVYASVTSINDVGDLCLHLLDERFTKEEYKCTMNEVCPIPITDGLMEKIGFKKNSFGWWRLDKRNDKFMIKSYSQISTLSNIEYWNEVHNPEDVTETNYGSTIELPYKIHLHTFQNIWHLLTGNELNIKL